MQLEIFKIGQKMSVRFHLLEAKLTISPCSFPLSSLLLECSYRCQKNLQHYEIHLYRIFISQSAFIIYLTLLAMLLQQQQHPYFTNEEIKT